MFVAVDEGEETSAHELIASSAQAGALVKIGLECFTALGIAILAFARELGVEFFLDLKIHDVPATARRAAKRAAMHGASYLTVHASGGLEMLVEAMTGVHEGEKEAKREFGSCKVLAVTELTSMDREKLAETGVDVDNVDDLIKKRALLSAKAGCDGVICSPREAAMLRPIVPMGFLIVTPGVRGLNEAKGDQVRTDTIEAAIAGGADMIVVGRRIRDAQDRKVVFREILGEIIMGEFRRRGIWLKDGHFVLQSGAHSTDYVEKAMATVDPVFMMEVAYSLAQFMCEESIEVVVGPAVGAIIPAFALALALSEISGRVVQCCYAEKDGQGGFMLKRGYGKLVAGKCTLTLEDVLTSGASSAKVNDALLAAGASLIGTAVLWNRGNVSAYDTHSQFLLSLVNHALGSWPEVDCRTDGPCKDGVSVNTEHGHGATYVQVKPAPLASASS